MELWIRSQDKTNLILAKDIVVSEETIKVYKDTELCTTVAKYKTKERALEVLDEIQDFITLNEKIDGDYEEKDLKIKSVFVANQLKIFQMPEE